MKAELHMFFRGELFEIIPISLPDHSDDLGFEENVKIRTDYVQYEVNRLRVMYTRKMVRYDYDVILVLGSKMNEEDLEDLMI